MRVFSGDQPPMDTDSKFFTYMTVNNVKVHIRLETIDKIYETEDRLDFLANGERHELTAEADKGRLLASLGIRD